MKKLNTATLSMDAPAKDGTLLRLTVHRTDAGHIEEANPLEVAAHHYGTLQPLVAYTVGSVLHVEGQLNLHDLEPGLTIEKHWMMTVQAWLQMLTEELAPA